MSEVVSSTIDAAEGPARRSGTWSSAGIVFVGNVIARGLGFLFPLVLARAVDRADFAFVYLTITTGFFVGELVLAGYPTSLTRFLAAPGDAPRGAWLTSAVVAGLGMLVLSVLAGVLFAVQADADPWLLTLVIIGLSIDAYYFATLRGLSRFSWLVAYRIGANLAQIVALVLAWQAGVASVPLAVVIYAFTYLVPIVVIEIVRSPLRQLLDGGRRPSRPLLASLTAFAIPALISGTAYAAIMGLDVYWVRLLAPTALPDYSAARALAMPMSLVPFAIGVVLLPRVASTAPGGQWRLLGQAIGATVVTAAAAVLGYVLLGATVIGIVYPEGYHQAATILPPLALAMGVAGIYSVLSQWWMGRGDPHHPAIALVCGAVAAALGHVLLDPVYGGVGAAMAMLIGSVTAIAILGVMTWCAADRPGRVADGGVP